MIDVITTSLRQIRATRHCLGIYKTLYKKLGGVRKYGLDTPITFKQIYQSDGYGAALWCLKTVDSKWFPLLRHFACDCAEDVKHLWKDERPFKAIEVARRYADGLATADEVMIASLALRAAASVADWGPAYYVLAAAARAVDWVTDNDFANDAANYAALAASDWGATREKQMQRLFKYCELGRKVEDDTKTSR